jgi:GT2 family glycosyltransferase
MSKQDVIGVVTVTFNSASVIGDFMSSLLKQTHTRFILYVVDNSSSDETLKRLSELPDSRVRIISNLKNVGVAEGNNIGIRAALKDECASVLLINNDTVFEQDVLSRLSEGLEKYECDMTVPKILFYDTPTRIWSAGAYFSRWRGSARHFGYGRHDDGRFDQPRVVNYSPTCCLLVSKRVFVYFDDTDFCYRAHRAGVKLFYVPAARLFHRVSSLTGSDSAFSIRHNIRNHVYYLLKNFPRWQLLFYLPAFQIHIFVRFVIWKRSLGAFSIAEKAFMEGVSHYRAHVGRAGSSLDRSEAQ